MELTISSSMAGSSTWGVMDSARAVAASWAWERSWLRSCSRELSTPARKLPVKATTRNRQIARNSCLSNDIVYPSPIGKPSARIFCRMSCQRESLLLSPLRLPPVKSPSALKA